MRMMMNPRGETHIKRTRQLVVNLRRYKSEFSEFGEFGNMGCSAPKDPIKQDHAHKTGPWYLLGVPSKNIRRAPLCFCVWDSPQA